ncbi:hypothetical protein QMK33_21630 [Hymenobacter sp. H14-R3]|uniref:hypothetical protein n=1 Tax=Hymenobacter sp. H14-R3 TaxID=3046308 RepID=UPI0024B905EA|nr:hypothetical protein [Hymenobacter sp. H14-R3]MDJ0367755.1 hypothetical protein [Hymenobacter sp. H14-R3]
MRFATFLMAVGLGVGGAASPCAAQSHEIDLSTQALAVPGRTFYIRQVLDGRPVRAGIGTVRRGMANVPQRADLKPTVTLALQALLTQQLPAQPTDQPVLAVVRALHVQEDLTFTTEQATDEVALDFYLLDAQGNAHFAGSTHETVQSKGLETTGRHPRQLAQALQACLVQLAGTDWAAVAAQPGHPVAELPAARPVARQAYPVLTDSVRPAGFYRTFLDFRNNTPVASPALVVVPERVFGKGWGGVSTYTPYLQEPDGRRGAQLRGAWGFSDGRQVYLLHRKRYWQLARQGDTFGFVGPSVADAGAVSTGAVLGGLAGAALASASTSGRPTDYTLSLLTGRVSTLAEDDYVTTPDTVLLHIYCRKSSLGTKPEPVYLNEKLVGQLSENQLLTISYTEHVGEMHLRLGTRKDRELVFQPDFLHPIYVKVVRYPDDETRPPMELVSAQVGTFDLRVIKPRAAGE